MGLILILIFLSISSSYGFDHLDPKGSIILRWDLLQSTAGSYDVTVTIVNTQLYRHIDLPGWKLGWDWKNKEVIWNMVGAEATEQGNCTDFLASGNLPHCCEKHPTIIDLLPGTPYNLQTSNCCKGGVLSSMTQDYSRSVASFQMNVGASDTYSFDMPQNFTIGIPGYTCTPDAVEVEPTKFSKNGGRRKTQALRTWNVTCDYSQFVSSPTPKCCVSLSAFYNSSIVPCPTCSCGCQGLSPGPTCVKFEDTPPLLQQMHSPAVEPAPLVRCTNHMCPIKVHWHVKESYQEYWRVKMSITNYNIIRNYTDWNLVVLHPNLENITQVFSFNYQALDQTGYVNNTGMFWGIHFYNDMLLQQGVAGNVQSEVLLRKEKSTFTFKDGWTFPRRIMFNGDECVMPVPDDFPRLPNTAFSSNPRSSSWFLLLLLLFLIGVV